MSALDSWHAPCSCPFHPKPSFTPLKDEDRRVQRDGSRWCVVYPKGDELMGSWNDFAASASFSFIGIREESKHLESNPSSAAQSRLCFRPTSDSPAPCCPLSLKRFYLSIWLSLHPVPHVDLCHRHDSRDVVQPFPRELQ